MRLDHASMLVLKEFERATSMFPSFNTPHEGFAVLQEEIDELWAEVKNVEDRETAEHIEAMRTEAIQVAAMALRFLVDCV